MTTALSLLLLLQVKHFVCDFPLQWKYQYANKGTYGHPGGILHAAIHQLGSVLVFFAWGHWLNDWWWILMVEAIVHYHIDWAKMNINKCMGWGPLTHERFWWLLGFDQLLHQLTYVWMIWMVT